MFLTGATGCLGMLLLRHLADAGVAGPGPREVVVLVRAGKQHNSAQERFRKEVRAKG